MFDIWYYRMALENWILLKLLQVYNVKIGTILVLFEMRHFHWFCRILWYLTNIAIVVFTWWFNMIFNDVLDMEIYFSHSFMMSWGMMFGEIIGMVILSFAPEYFDCFKILLILDPMVSHIPALTSFLFYHFLYKWGRRAVVYLYGSWYLIVIEYSQ